MNEPRHRDEYSSRQTEAARRVLVDLGQVLASFLDCLVVVGGWVPDLLIPEAKEPPSPTVLRKVELESHAWPRRQKFHKPVGATCHPTQFR